MPTPHREYIGGKILSSIINKTKQIKITWEYSRKCFDSLTIYLKILFPIALSINIKTLR